MLDRLHDAARLRTNPIIFFSAVAIVLGFVLCSLLFTETMNAVFVTGAGWVMENLGWFYILGVSVFLLFLIYVGISRFGGLRLGTQDSRPEHSTLAWFAMLFAAGIGTILMFWAVAEPISHFAAPPFRGVEPESKDAARSAMAITLYHFGLHTWTIFALPALCFGYFMYKRNLPPRVSSMFQPLLGARIHGPIGKLIDIVALVGTLTGVAVSIGLGTLQINAGLASLFGISESALSQILIIAAVTIVASVSVALGLDRGIKVLSNTNILLAIGLLVFVLVSGPTVMLLRGTIEWFGVYMQELPGLMFWNDTLDDTGWQNGWTVFYWAWTITWSPFVGIFIAQISKGRSIRQFIGGVLGLPVLFSVIWFGIFGTAVFDIEFNQGGGLVETVVGEGDIPGAIFAFLGHFPLTEAFSVLAIVIVTLFFITSMDSAGLVMDNMASGHDDAAPAHQRVWWVVAIGLVAATILVGAGKSGLSALENVAILIGLPFFVLGYFQMWSLLRAMREDAGEVAPLKSRRWRRTLPPEEYERRAQTGALDPEYVIAPDHYHGTEPEHSPELEHPEQPDVVQDYRRRTGEQDVVDSDETAAAARRR